MLKHEKMRAAFHSKKIAIAIDFLSHLVILVTVIAVFVPLSPRMPGSGLDSSWHFAINQAVAQGLTFGKDIIFTFGPYASIFTKTYHPSTDYMMVGGSLYLALSYWSCFVLLIKHTQWGAVLIFCVVVAGQTMDHADALLFAYPLLAGLVSFKILFSEEGMLAKSQLAPFYVVFLSAPLGLLPLIKGTVLILCGAIAILCLCFFIANKQIFLGIICLISPLVSMLLFWELSGQHLKDLPYYFLSMVPIISGYTEAMALKGKIREVISFLMAAAVILLSIGCEDRLTSNSKKFLIGGFFVFLFISFKAGFVRHDAHALISGTSILIAALFLPFVCRSRIAFPAMVPAVISAFYIDSQYIEISTAHYVDQLKSTYSSAWNGFRNRIKDNQWPRRDFDAAMESLKLESSFPRLPGVTDIYSSNQTYLIASGNAWSPRPVFQSYSAYTLVLAEKNRKHLLGSGAPDNIIFEIKPIDNRLPSIEDGASWPALLANYQPVRMERDFLFLRKNERIGAIPEPSTLGRETHYFGDRVNLPRSNQPIFLQIVIKPTILGRIASFLFKPSELKITLDLKNGSTKQYRFIAGMAQSGFLLSPLVENPAELAMLYGEITYWLDQKLVKAFTISPRHGKSVLWNHKFTVSISQIKKTSLVDISKIYKFDRLETQLGGATVTVAEKCQGAIDLVNDISPVPTKFSVSGPFRVIRVTGWLVAAIDIDKASLPDAVYVVLTDNQGNRKFLKTRRMRRMDVGAYFKRPELNDSGYSTMADVSTLSGQFTLGLAIKKGNEIKICSQFKIPVTITR